MAARKQTKRYVTTVFLLILLLAAAAIYEATSFTRRRNTEKDDFSYESLLASFSLDQREIDWSNYSESYIPLGTNSTITQSGVYRIGGELGNGMLKVNIPNGFVKLILDNVTIRNNAGPAIYIMDAKQAEISLETDSTNSLSDAQTHGDYEDIDAVIYSEADLVFSGDGELEIKAIYSDAIASKKDLTFKSGNYQISANDDAIRGKNSVVIENGNFNIFSRAHAIKATNEAKPQKGFILVRDGVFAIHSQNGKGFNAKNSLLIERGEFSLDTKDDGLHSDRDILLLSPNISISSEERAIHADHRCEIDKARIDITASREGVEAAQVTIHGSTLSIAAEDDGINASSASGEESILSIEGGEITIVSDGDGLDSNGELLINDGKIRIDAAIVDGYAALDSETPLRLAGGEIIALDNGDLDPILADDLGLTTLQFDFASNLMPGTQIQLLDEVENTVIELDVKRAAKRLFIASKLLQVGRTYKVVIGKASYEPFQINDQITKVKL